MKNVLSLLATIALSTSVIGGLNSTLNLNSNNIIDTLANNNLSDIIKVTDLGRIEMNKTKPTKAELLKAIKIKNPEANELTTNHFKFKPGEHSSTSSTIIGIGKYQGEVTLTYIRTGHGEDLNELIKNKNLGSFNIENSTPTKAELLKAIKVNNKGLGKLKTTDFEFQEIVTNKSATIVGVGKYQGQVKLIYDAQYIINLSSIIKETNLGKIKVAKDHPNYTELLEAIKIKNPEANELTVNDFEINGYLGNTIVFIKGIGKYYGYLALSYSTK